VYEGKKDAAYTAGSQVARLDPVTVVSVMAAVTKSLGFGVTGSVSYIRTYDIFVLVC
jgi:alkanesulfonate monooxygenase SsuD/methylene tetrahydromethanopterin reductase-like flavin-dependent oxidoreductase (luciferase family)